MSFADRWEAIGTSIYWFHTWPQRYGFALMALTAAALFRYGVGVHLGFTQPFIVFYPTILLITLLCGFGPALFATSQPSPFAPHLSFHPPNPSPLTLPLPTL